MELASAELAFDDGTVWCLDAACAVQQVVFEVPFFDCSATRDYLALAVQLVVFELTFEDLAVFLGDAAETGELSALEFALQDGAIDLGDLAWPMHDVLMEDTLADGSTRADDLRLSVQVVILELPFRALALVDVPTEPIDAVQSITPHLQLTLIEELLLALAIVVDDIDAAQLALLLEVFAVLDLNKLFDPADPALTFELELVAHGQLLEVQGMLTEVLVEQLVALGPHECLVHGPVEHFLDDFEGVPRGLLDGPACYRGLTKNVLGGYLVLLHHMEGHVHRGGFGVDTGASAECWQAL